MVIFMAKSKKRKKMLGNRKKAMRKKTQKFKEVLSAQSAVPAGRVSTPE